MSLREHDRVEHVGGLELRRTGMWQVHGEDIFLIPGGAPGRYQIVAYSIDSERLSIVDRMHYGGDETLSIREWRDVLSAMLDKPIRLRKSETAAYTIDGTEWSIRRWGDEWAITSPQGYPAAAGAVDSWPTRRAACEAYERAGRDGAPPLT